MLIQWVSDTLFLISSITCTLLHLAENWNTGNLSLRLQMINFRWLIAIHFLFHFNHQLVKVSDLTFSASKAQTENMIHNPKKSLAGYILTFITVIHSSYSD